MYSTNPYVVWKDLREIYDKVNEPRLYQVHRKIVLTQQDLNYVSTFSTRLKFLLDEYYATSDLDPSGCENFKKHIDYYDNQ